MIDEKTKKILDNIIWGKENASVLIFGAEGIGKFWTLKNYLQEKNKLLSDLIIIDSESKFFQIDTARFISNISSYKTDFKRIILVNDFHKFQKEAQNVLLKVLEKTNVPMVFFLVTHRLNKVLSTIKSRSLLLRFPLPSYEEHLEILKKRNYNLDDIKLVLKIYPFQPGKTINLLENSAKIKILKKFIKSDNLKKILLLEEIEKNFSLAEFLEILLNLERVDLLKNKINLNRIKRIMSLYFDSDYYLNDELQLINLILNYG